MGDAGDPRPIFLTDQVSTPLWWSWREGGRFRCTGAERTCRDRLPPLPDFLATSPGTALALAQSVTALPTDSIGRRLATTNE